MTIKRVKLLSYSLAVLFLVVHVVMYIIFKRNNVLPMEILNLLSITFYVVMLILILNDKIRTFIIACFLEINIHMGAAIHFTGWNSGFQITLIGICILLAYAEYAARSLHRKHIRFILLSPIALFTYLRSFYVSLQRPAPYPLPEHVANSFQVAWAIIVFLIIFIVLQIFVYYAAASQDELRNEAMHDKLTGLPNRVYMSEYLQTVSEAKDQSQYWLAIIDLDDFKICNDTYGHNCGDYVLVTIANILKSPGIEVCRWGGEEFLLVGKRVNNGPVALLQQIRQTVHDYDFEYEGKHIHMTMTIGMAWKKPEMSLDEWISTADKKLYEGKAAGKDRVCY